MEKKRNAAVTLVSLLLLLACVVGLVAVNVYGEDDKIKDDPDIGNSGDINEPNVDDTSKPDLNSTSTFYICPDTNLGYRTIGNSTVFFLKVDAPEMHLNDERYGADWHAYILFDEIVGYNNAPIDLKMSYNTGITWSDMELHEEGIGLGTGNINADHESVYISYIFVDNCSSPEFVLDDLKSKIFNVKYLDTFSQCVYYENFRVHVSNEWIAPPGTPLG